MTAIATDRGVRAASLEELRAAGRLVVHLDRHTLCLFAEGEEVYAVDNRCPHMGFPLHRGTVCDGILTCHWHHARFDLATGGTFDQFADELRRFPVAVDGDDVLVDLSPRDDPVGHQRKRLGDALERDIPLVLAKATLALLEADPSGLDLFRSGIDFGVVRRGEGWFRGLTTLTCMMNLVPRLDEPEQRRRALPRACRRRLGLGDRPAALPARPASGDAARARTARGAGSEALSRCATQRAQSARSCRPSGRARRRRSSPTCSSRPPPTTATSTAGTRSTSSTRRSKPSTSPAGTAPKRCSARCRHSSPSPSAWRRPTPGATRSTFPRCSRPRSSAFRGRWKRAPRAAAAGTAATTSSRC